MPAGSRSGPEFITIEPTGGITDVDQFNSILISGGGKQQIYLRDVATVRRGYVEPQTSLIRYDGQPAIGLGISTVSGGNVVKMGKALERRVAELQSKLPVGIEAGMVSVQSQAVETAVNGFLISLLEAVVIVIVVLLFFMGLRSGLLIGFVLFLTIAGTFIFMAPMQVALERISLGALIIALGMLVDNAIVVVDGVLVRLQKGIDAKQGAIEVVGQTAIPLLGATVIAILAFAAIGTSEDSTGEFCRSLYQVVLVSLLLSWVTAVTVTPLLCVMFLKPPASGEARRIPTTAGFTAVTSVFCAAPSAARRSPWRGRRTVFRQPLGFRLRRAEFLPALDTAAVHGGSVAAAGHPYRRDHAHRRVGGAVPARVKGCQPRDVAGRQGRVAVPADLHAGKTEQRLRPVAGGCRVD